jgi:hypothetical protein
VKVPSLPGLFVEPVTAIPGQIARYRAGRRVLGVVGDQPDVWAVGDRQDRPLDFSAVSH